MTSAVQKASQALNERGERLGRAEEKTEDMKNSAQQFAETAHKVGPAEGQRSPLRVVRELGLQETHVSAFPMVEDTKSSRVLFGLVMQPAVLVSTRIMKGFLYLFLCVSLF